jgi:hypothetical protein
MIKFSYRLMGVNQHRQRYFTRQGLILQEQQWDKAVQASRYSRVIASSFRIE